MDLTQATQTLTWLNEEHRRQKAQLMELQDRLESQATQITALMKVLEDLEGRLTRTQAQLVRFPRIEQALQQLKNEIVLMLQKHEEQHRQADEEAARARLADKEAEAKRLAELQKQLEALPGLEKKLKSQAAEDKRLGKVVLDLQRGIADLAKQYEAPMARLRFLEEREKQSAKQMAELQIFEKKLKEDHARFMEKQQLAEQTRRRQMAEWVEEIESWRKLNEGWSAQLQQLKKQHQENVRALAALQELEGGLKQTHKELAHLQHLGEERQKKQINEWREESDKRWAQYEAEWQRQWKEQSEFNKEILKRIEHLEEQSDKQQAQILALLQAQEQYARRQVAEIEDLIGDAKERIAEAAGSKERKG